MDPLSALRDFTIRGELNKISRVNGKFRFGSDCTFPCTADTAYRSKQGNLYTIEALIYYINNHHVKHTEYLQNARDHKICPVTFPDRKPLLDYLTGKVSSSDSIEFIVPNMPSVDDEYHPGDPVIAGTIVDVVDNRTDYMAILMAIERPLRDRESLLECKNMNFLNVLTAATKREDDRQRKDGLVAKGRLMGSDDSGSGYGPNKKQKIQLNIGGKMGEGVPIILVPSASRTPITINNVKEFLEDGVFIPTESKVEPRPDCVTVQRKVGRDRDRAAATPYEVRDKPSSLKPEDWNRVVAVFVLGKEWQFKDWPFKDQVEILNKVVGFYICYEDDSLESTKIVKQWNVKIISISKNKPHQVKTAVLELWERLEEFVRSHSHS